MFDEKEWFVRWNIFLFVSKWITDSLDFNRKLNGWILFLIEHYLCGVDTNRRKKKTFSFWPDKLHELIRRKKEKIKIQFNLWFFFCHSSNWTIVYLARICNYQPLSSYHTDVCYEKSVSSVQNPYSFFSDISLSHVLCACLYVIRSILMNAVAKPHFKLNVKWCVCVQF